MPASASCLGLRCIGGSKECRWERAERRLEHDGLGTTSTRRKTGDVCARLAGAAKPYAHDERRDFCGLLKNAENKISNVYNDLG